MDEQLKKRTNKLPSSIFYIVGNEAAERFSFYGMKAILTVYLVTTFFNPTNNPELETIANAKANQITHLFNTLVYLLPLLGAIIADWFWGKYKTIVYLSLVYCVGNFFLAQFNTTLPLFMVGLYLIAFGAGGIKPCVSANVGDQFNEGNKHLISKAYSWFYFSINVGSFVSIFITPILLNKYGPYVAFGLPGILMILATIVFVLGKNKFVKLPPTGVKKENFFSINWYALRNRRKKEKGKPLLDVAKEKFSKEAVEGIKSVWKIMAIFSVIPIFWALNDQNSSEWVLQATKMDLHFFGHEWLAQQIQVVNPILVLIYIPLFNYFIFPLLEKSGISLTPYKKIGAGFILTLVSFIFIYWIQTEIDISHKPNIGWQIIAYVVITAGEVLIYQTGLEFAYTQAPPSMKSTIMSFWLLTIAIGNWIVSLINQNISKGGIFSSLTGASYYMFFIILIGVATIAYYLIVWKYMKKGKDTLQTV